MNVVCGRIVILDFNVLTGHRAQHVRVILATLLVDGDGFLGKVKGAVAQALFYINENIGQLAAIDDDGLSRVGALASGILAHINLGGLGSCAVEFHGAAD